MFKKNLIALVVFSSCATFRRAGHGFTDQGTAFAIDHFSEGQRKAIDAEPRLSVKELPADTLPESIDRSPLDAALAKAEAAAPNAKTVEGDNANTSQTSKKPVASKAPVNAKKEPAPSTKGSGSGGDTDQKAPADKA
jgi:hypothetical protein